MATPAPTRQTAIDLRHHAATLREIHTAAIDHADLISKADASGRSGDVLDAALSLYEAIDDILASAQRA